MSERQETVADIIAEMRGIRVREFQDYADRLEAAHKREVREAEDLFRKSLKKQEDTLRDQYEALVGFSNAAKLRETISTLRTALKEIRNDVLDMVMNYKSEDPDSYAHGLCLSIGGACDMALNSTKEFDNANK